MRFQPTPQISFSLNETKTFLIVPHKVDTDNRGNGEFPPGKKLRKNRETEKEGK